jgi:GWxTD domain-containing protein
MPLSFRAAALMTLAAAAGLAPAALSAAEKLDKDAKKWLDDVRPIILPDEEKTFRALKDKSEREEFQKIFWARRDPDLATPANEYRTEYEAAKADVDPRFRVSGRAGAATDCGRVYILLGAPDDVKRDPGMGGGGSRTPETWIYRDRPGMKFTGGQAQIMFDAECQLPQGARLGQQMNEVAGQRIVNTNIDYRTGSDGRLVKLADQLPKPSAGSALLQSPRQDFPLTLQNKMFLRSPSGGGSYVAGLIRGDASALAQEGSGTKTVKVLVAANAVDDSGRVHPATEREVVAEVGPDNSFLTSYGIALKPGAYTLNVAAVERSGQKGAVASAPVTMPDFGTDDLAISEVMILRDVQENVTVPANDPYWAFSMGSTRLLPTFDNVFSAGDSVMLLTVLYNPRAETQTPSADGQAATPTEAAKVPITVGFTISKDGKVLAQAPDQTYDTASATPGVGPVPLAKYGPGKYLVRMKVRDNLAQKDYTKEAAFEIR